MAEEAPRRFHFGDIYKEGRYEPLHDELFKPEAPKQWARWLDPAFFEAASKAADNGWKTVLREEAPGVYSFPLFKPEFCDMLLEEVEHAQSTRREMLERPNGMNRYGIVLNQLGLEPVITALQQEHLLPMQASLFPEEGGQADDHHCFIVRYKAGEDVGLDMHEDDADVTLNVCLGKEFEAATLTFCGLAAEEDHRKLKHTYSHLKGRAVLHRGRHRHGADNIERGERVNFILWSTNALYRSSETYMLHRMRRSTADAPDPICLSYTHDNDYSKHLPVPTREEAIARGVMLDAVERRKAVRERPVHDLARPLEEINQVPSVCLFMEGLPKNQVQQLFNDLMVLATSVRQQQYSTGSEASQLLFFVAVQPVGAVPQVRELCGVGASPALCILDVAGERVFRREQSEELRFEDLAEFVDAFFRGELQQQPLGRPPTQAAGPSGAGDVGGA